MDLVTPGIGLVFWTTVVFVILLVLLKKFAWKPILSAVKEREESIESALSSAEKAKEEMQALQADNERILKEARAERDGMLKDAREMKDKIIEEAKEKAKTETSRLIADATSQIENQKMAAITDMKNQVAEMSIEIAELVLGAELADKEKQSALVSNQLNDFKLN